MHVRIRYKRVKEKSSLLGTLAEKSPSIFRKQKGDKSVSKDAECNSVSPMMPRSDMLASKGLATHANTTLSSSPSLPVPVKTPPQQVLHSQRSSSLSSVDNDSQRLHRSPLLASKSPSSSGSSTNRALPTITPQLNSDRLPSMNKAATVNLPVCTLNGGLSSISPDIGDRSTEGDRNQSKLPGSPLTAEHRSNSSNTLSIQDPLSVRHRSSSSNDLSLSYSRITNPSRASDFHSSLLSIPDTLGSTSHKTTVDDPRTETAVMDVYVLKHTSDFYHQLTVAWDNWDIVSVTYLSCTSALAYVQCELYYIISYTILSII